MNEKKDILSYSDQKDMNFSMRLSFLVGVFMLAVKCYAYIITDSTAIMSDAAESIIHVFAVGFAAYSMWLSLKPADADHLYGHEKISFFSAGFEGAMIVIAALFIYFESVQKMIYGVELQNIGTGLIFILAAIAINFLLGYYLISKGKKYKSIILEANGKHILTDCLTSISVIIALTLVKLTGISLFDPIVALLAATNILWTGVRLIRKSIGGLMDQTDPALHKKITALLIEETSKRNMEFHHLRHRMSGHRIFIEFHLLFADDIKLGKAHEIASEIEARLRDALDMHAEISSHLELKTHHDDVHQRFGLPI
jgi:cation diffusion facilitator family transporter